MGTQLTNYQCPSCTGPLHYSGTTGKMECEYCGTSYEPSAIEELYADREAAAAKAAAQTPWEPELLGGEWDEEEAQRMRAYNCPSCGAQLICDDTTIATSCPYCNNPTVVPSQFSGTLKPNYIIPFRMDKEAAMEALKKHYKGKRFLPKSFAEDNAIEEIKGLYVPFWLFDGESAGDINYRATRVFVYRRGDYEITATDHFHIRRQGNVAFEKIPVDGSSKMPDAHMDAIEPYDYTGLVPFSTAYLPGFLADKYDEDESDCIERANKRIHNSTENAIRNTVSGYATVIPQNTYIDIQNTDAKYALLPVWMLNTKWKDKDFLFAMNAQTGKLIGDLPVDWGKYWIWFISISLPLMIVLWFFLLRGL